MSPQRSQVRFRSSAIRARCGQAIASDISTPERLSRWARTLRVSRRSGFRSRPRGASFVVGIVLILLGIALAVLLPAATHERILALIALIFVVAGLGGLSQSRFTPVEPDRLSLANAVMRARLDALRTDDPGEITQGVTKEREIGDLLFRMALPSRNAGPRSWPAEWSRGDETTPNSERDPT